MTSSTLTAPLLRPAEVCRLLGVSRSWLYQSAADGLIPCIRLGYPHGPLRFHPDDLIDWIERARAAWRPGDTASETMRRVIAAAEAASRSEG